MIKHRQRQYGPFANNADVMSAPVHAAFLIRRPYIRRHTSPPPVSLGLVLLSADLSADSSAEARSAKAEARSAKTGATSMPVVAERYYRMLAKVRPLLFWISRDDVGGARIGWLGDQGGSKGFELLIGSDPAWPRKSIAVYIAKVRALPRAPSS